LKKKQQEEKDESTDEDIPKMEEQE